VIIDSNTAIVAPAIILWIAGWLFTRVVGRCSLKYLGINIIMGHLFDK